MITPLQPDFLYHGTSSRFLPIILQTGLRSRDGWTGSHWGSADVAGFFARQKAKEKGGRQVVIKIPFCRFEEPLLGPDLNIMDFTIPLHEADFERRLSGLANPQRPTWQESWQLFDAVIYSGVLYPSRDECLDLKGRPVEFH